VARTYYERGCELACTGLAQRRGVTLSDYPHVHELDESVLVCLGYNGRSGAMSSAMGPELARRVMSRPFDMPVTTIREMPFHELWRPGVAARVAYAVSGHAWSVVIVPVPCWRSAVDSNRQ